MIVEPEKAEALRLARALGGREIEIKTATGERLTVFVRCPPLRQLIRYLELQGEPAALAEFLTMQSEGWADTLPDESTYAICEAGRELNDPRLGRFLQSQREAADKLAARMPGGSSSSPQTSQ